MRAFFFITVTMCAFVVSSAAEDILKRGSAEILGYRLSEVLFLTCDKERMAIDKKDVIRKAPPTQKCNNRPSPILGEVVSVNTNAQRVLLRIGNQTNVFLVPADALKDLKPKTKVSATVIEGHVYELHTTDPGRPPVKVETGNNYILPPTNAVPSSPRTSAQAPLQRTPSGIQK